MTTQNNHASLDDHAAHMAARMLKSMKADKMPAKQDEANGGLSDEGDASEMEAKGKKSSDGEYMNKSSRNRTDAKASSEPGREGPAARVGADTVREPDADEEDGDAGEPADVDQTASADRATRTRRGPGKAPESEMTSSEKDKGTRERRGMAKSVDEELVDADELIKGLETLESLAAGHTIAAPESRRQELAKGLADGTLSKAEKAELSELLKGGKYKKADEDMDMDMEDMDMEDEDEDMEKSLEQWLSEDEELQKGFDASPFLERFADGFALQLKHSHGALAKALDTFEDGTRQFNTQLAKSLGGMARLVKDQHEIIKSLQDRLDVVEKTPVGRLGHTTASALHKSIDGEAGAPARGLSKSQVLDALEDMSINKSISQIDGRPLSTVISAVEMTGTVSPGVHRAVVSYLNNKR